MFVASNLCRFSMMFDFTNRLVWTHAAPKQIQSDSYGKEGQTRERPLSKVQHDIPEAVHALDTAITTETSLHLLTSH